MRKAKLLGRPVWPDWFFIAAAFWVAFMVVGGGLPFAVVGASDDIWCSDWISMACGTREEAHKFNLNTSPSSLTDSFTCNYEDGCRLSSVLIPFDLESASCAAIYFKKNNTRILEISPTCLYATTPCFQTPTKGDLDRELSGVELYHSNTLSIECVPPILGCLFGTCYTNVNINYVGSFDRLVWCSHGPTATSCDAAVTGVPVAGADGCAFNLDEVTNKASGVLDAVLNQTGQQIATKSYVVPVGQAVWLPYSGTRHVCGTLTPDCSADSHCYGRYPFDYGSGYGNADIVGGELNQYKCLATGPSGCVRWSGTVKGEGTCLDYESGLQCSGVRTGFLTECNPMVPGTCGANAFCDPETYTCEATGTVVCDSEFDPTCVDVTCDRVGKVLKEGYCASPGTTESYCTYRTLRNIDCCSKADCFEGYYCTTDYKCELSVSDKQECPNECCQGMEKYFDKPLTMPAGKECCPDHSLADIGKCDEEWRCLSNDDCDAKEECKDGKCVSTEVCEDRLPVSLFSLGWKTVSTETPVYLINFPWGGGIGEVGKTTETTCVEVIDWVLISLLVGVAAFALVLVWLLRRPIKRASKKRRRRKWAKS